MKKILTIAAALMMTASVWAQSPEKMSYQAVVRDAGNALITTQPVGMQISILQGGATGTAVYVETQTPTTNANGLVSLEIGTGTIVSGDFTTIDWATDTFFIQTETDPTGGTAYTITGASQLMSVPYALYAKTSGSSTPGPQGAAGNDGANGIDGAIGNTGATGSQGVQGLPGSTGPQGLVGSTGPQGAAGLNGSDGGTGPTGATGAGSTVAGPQGVTGATGPQGIIGLTGTTGSAGATGPQGIIGLTGTTGSAGATGSQGIQGLPGNTGPQGVVGNTGSQGPIGATGAAGGSSGHYIGELFGGGIVFYVYNNGANGLIASLDDLDGGSGVAWSGNTSTLIGATAQSFYDGAANTTAMVTQDATANKAGTLCDSYTGGSQTDWYLPASWELNLLYNSAFSINTILENDANGTTNGLNAENVAPTYGCYWSSTETNSTYAWFYYFGRGNSFYDSKNFTSGVRAVRAF